MVGENSIEKLIGELKTVRDDDFESLTRIFNNIAPTEANAICLIQLLDDPQMSFMKIFQVVTSLRIKLTLLTKASPIFHEQVIKALLIYFNKVKDGKAALVKQLFSCICVMLILHSNLIRILPFMLEKVNECNVQMNEIFWLVFCEIYLVDLDQSLEKLKIGVKRLTILQNEFKNAAYEMTRKAVQICDEGVSEENVEIALRFLINLVRIEGYPVESIIDYGLFDVTLKLITGSWQKRSIYYDCVYIMKQTGTAFKIKQMFKYLKQIISKLMILSQLDISQDQTKMQHIGVGIYELACHVSKFLCHELYLDSENEPIKAMFGLLVKFASSNNHDILMRCLYFTEMLKSIHTFANEKICFCKDFCLSVLDFFINGLQCKDLSGTDDEDMEKFRKAFTNVSDGIIAIMTPEVFLENIFNRFSQPNLSQSTMEACIFAASCVRVYEESPEINAAFYTLLQALFSNKIYLAESKPPVKLIQTYLIYTKNCSSLISLENYNLFENVFEMINSLFLHGICENECSDLIISLCKKHPAKMLPFVSAISQFYGFVVSKENIAAADNLLNSLALIMLVADIAETEQGIKYFVLDLIERLNRAQSMDQKADFCHLLESFMSKLVFYKVSEKKPNVVSETYVGIIVPHLQSIPSEWSDHSAILDLYSRLVISCVRFLPEETSDEIVQLTINTCIFCFERTLYSGFFYGIGAVFEHFRISKLILDKMFEIYRKIYVQSQLIDVKKTSQNFIEDFFLFTKKYYRSQPEQFIQNGFVDPFMEYACKVLPHFGEPSVLDAILTTLSYFIETISLYGTETSRAKLHKNLMLISDECRAQVHICLQKYVLLLVDGLFENLMNSYTGYICVPSATFLLDIFMYDQGKFVEAIKKQLSRDFILPDGRTVNLRDDYDDMINIFHFTNVGMLTCSSVEQFIDRFVRDAKVVN